MIETNLDLGEIALKILEVARIVDINCGRGEAGAALFYEMVGATAKELIEATHAYEEDIATLRHSWMLDDIEDLPMRGFYDPHGLKTGIRIDPHAEKPEYALNYQTTGAFQYEENMPIFYHRWEFGRGGSHDAPGIVADHFDAHFEDGLKKFFSVLGGQLNSIDINTTSLGGMAALRTAAMAAVREADKVVRPIFL